ncbi:hypothetical protein, partial [Paracidovorax avenae]|uniref:hypothetical protein n=1 Tax=Paracidovorax avenae TaxID=80867 RepID=UPI001F2B7504
MEAGRRETTKKEKKRKNEKTNGSDDDEAGPYPPRTSGARPVHASAARDGNKTGRRKEKEDLWNVGKNSATTVGEVRTLSVGKEMSVT